MRFRADISNFETSDIFLAATLQSFDFFVTNLTWEDDKRCTFRFLDSSSLQEVVERFWNGQLAIEPRKLFASLKSLKTRLYSSR